MQVKVKGSVTEVKAIEIDISTEELVKAALPYMTVEDIIKVMKSFMEKRFRENDPDIPKGAIIDWNNKKWEIFYFEDYHKNEDIYKTLRKFNTQEEEYLLAIDSIYHVLNK